MAKGGRKHGLSNHERFLGSAGFGYGHGDDTGSDLVEEDVWSTVADNVGDNSSQHDWYDTGRNSGDRARQWVAREDRHMGGLSMAFDDDGRSKSRVINQFRNVESDHHHHRHHAAASAPVSVPDWPKISRVDSAESFRGSVEAAEGDDGEWVPPHEYLARENAASGKMVATSVFEGVGRTLKGRDMSRVRNAVWRQTGFFG